MSGTPCSAVVLVTIASKSKGIHGWRRLLAPGIERRGPGLDAMYSTWRAKSATGPASGTLSLPD
jgi:hypothetical protein